MGSGRTEGAHIGRNRRHGRAPRWQRMSKTGMRFLWPPPSAPNSNRLFSNLASRLYVLPSDAHTLGHPKAATGHPEHATPNFCQKLSWFNAQHETTNDALFRLDHLAVLADRLDLGRPPDAAH